MTIIGELLSFVILPPFSFYSYPIYVLTSLFTFFFINKINKPWLTIHLKALVSLWPFLAYFVFHFLIYGTIFDSLFYLMSALGFTTLILVEILSRLKSKIVVILALVVFTIIFFPKPSGRLGLMIPDRYQCQCLGFEVQKSAAMGSISLLSCYGIPYSCGPVKLPEGVF